MTLGHLYIGIFFVLVYFVTFCLWYFGLKRIKHLHNMPTDPKSSFESFNRRFGSGAPKGLMALGGGLILIFVYLVDYFNLYHYFSWWLDLFSV